jgi:hypothetical protein
MLVNLGKSKRKCIVVLLYSELRATMILLFRIIRKNLMALIALSVD